MTRYRPATRNRKNNRRGMPVSDSYRATYAVTPPRPHRFGYPNYALIIPSPIVAVWIPESNAIA